MKYLLIGNHGQLGSEFEDKLTELRKDFVAVDIDKVDICDYQAVTNLFSFVKPSIVINCAAYNDVDAAEYNKEMAFNVNAEAVKYLAYSAYKNHAFLIHFSSDYVFDGKKTNGMYSEIDETNPINTYGKSKLAGEHLLQNELDDYLLFRLSWVYGSGTQNFIFKLMQWAIDKEILKVTDDEISVPTSTQVIVDVVLNSIRKGLEGMFHLTNSGYCSRFQWAETIIKHLELNTKIEPVSQDYFKLPAKRPKFSAMSNSKISGELNIEIPLWEVSLLDFLNPKLI
ncbi:dTDP-4-dehydrorhamnose reductase [Bacteroidetes/Chlorobi group bacterium ChocPot_Mid]|nr:MAG: dTDP-4-dehydrorhamnose reductase [Bacteroidetes/Chlorobi group bacterium ChocPot_Mid]